MSVAITALGVCTPLGRTTDELWQRVAAGEDGFREVERFDLPGLNTRIASAFDASAVAALCAEADQADPALAYALLAARDAVAHLTPAQRRTTALVIATSAGAADTHDAYDRARKGASPLESRLLVTGAFTSFAAVIADALALAGPRTCVSTACASGGHALGIAADLAHTGAERVLVVGSDAVHPSLFAGFSSVGALAHAPCTPFGSQFGMSLGEGAGAILLEVDGVDPIAFLVGWGGSCDAYHPTAPDPRGAGMARSLADALADADVQPAEIGAYNAHGTGTEANDPAETFAVRAVLGDGVPVSATKSQLGHTQGAAGVLEAIVTIAGLVHQAVPPTLRCLPPRRIAPADPVPDGVARPRAHDLAMSNSAAFGGTNVTVVLGRRPRPRRGQPSGVYAHGIGVVGVADAALALDPEHTPAPVGPGPRARARRADPVTTFLTDAVALACAAAGIGPGARDDVAVVAGMADGPQHSIRRFVDSRDQRGLANASASAFARMVFNAPAGAAATAVQLRGANLTLWSGHGAGAQAVLVARNMLVEHERIGAVVACAADERGHITEDRASLALLAGAPLQAGAAMVLSRTPGPVRLAGAAWGSDGDWEAVAAGLGDHADRVIVTAEHPHRVPWPGCWRLEPAIGHAPAASGILACAAAYDWILAGSAGTVLVLSIARDSGSTALLWTA